MVHIGAFVALLWLSIFAFNTLAINALGFAMLVLALVFLPLTFTAILHDWNNWHGND